MVFSDILLMVLKIDGCENVIINLWSKISFVVILAREFSKSAQANKTSRSNKDMVRKPVPKHNRRIVHSIKSLSQLLPLAFPQINVLIAMAPCLRLLLITMKIAVPCINFFSCISMCWVGNENFLSCKVSLTLTSYLNSLLFPLNKIGIQFSQIFSIYQHAKRIKTFVVNSLVERQKSLTILVQTVQVQSLSQFFWNVQFWHLSHSRVSKERALKRFCSFKKNAFQPTWYECLAEKINSFLYSRVIFSCLYL